MVALDDPFMREDDDGGMQLQRADRRVPVPPSRTQQYDSGGGGCGQPRLKPQGVLPHRPPVAGFTTLV